MAILSALTVAKGHPFTPTQRPPHRDVIPSNRKKRATFGQPKTSYSLPKGCKPSSRSGDLVFITAPAPPLKTRAHRISAHSIAASTYESPPSPLVLPLPAYYDPLPGARGPRGPRRQPFVAAEPLPISIPSASRVPPLTLHPVSHLREQESRASEAILTRSCRVGSSKELSNTLVSHSNPSSRHHASFLRCCFRCFRTLSTFFHISPRDVQHPHELASLCRFALALPTISGFQSIPPFFDRLPATQSRKTSAACPTVWLYSTLSPTPIHCFPAGPQFTRPSAFRPSAHPYLLPRQYSSGRSLTAQL